MKQSHIKHFKRSNSATLKEQVIYNRINVFQNEKLPNHIDLNLVLKKFQTCIPAHFLDNLDSIYIGNFDFLLDRDLNAVYKDGAIYVSPEQDNEEDMLDDLIHEVAHCVEESYGLDIYDDLKIENEFLKKRLALYNVLKSRGYNVLPRSDYLSTEYSEDFDEFLYMMVGYPTLTKLTVSLFVSPYGATSLREYFANCFEEYFAKKNYKEVKLLSPSVYEKIDMLLGKNYYDY